MNFSIILNSLFKIFINFLDIKFGFIIIFNIKKILFERSKNIVNSYIKLNNYSLFLYFII